MIKFSITWRSMLSLLVTFAVLAVLTATGDAATKGGNGLRISPVRSDLTIKPGETYNLTVNVTNVTAETSNLEVIINDFVANINETGQPSILLNPEDFAPRHSLKRFVEPVDAVTLRPGEQKAVTIRITIPANAPGGGYFGAVRFGPAGAISTSPNENVSLAGNVGSLVLVKVPGDVTEKLTIASFDARTSDRARSFFTSNKNIAATVRFQNGGNIQVEPFGKILLKNRSGKVLAQYEVNNTTPAGTVLPDSIRKFPITLDKVGKFGQYKLEGHFGYGSTGQPLSASTTFYVIPLWVILAFVAVVAFLAFLIFGLPRLIKAYNRRVLRRAGRR